MGAFLELVRIEHTLFALPFAYTAAFLAAGGIPPADKLLWITVALIGAWNGAMAANRLIDLEYDAQNPRTKDWVLVRGRLRPRQVQIFMVANLASLIYAAYRLGPICLALSPLALFFLIFYSYTKRFTPLVHFFLGGTIGLASLGAWLAVAERLTWAPIFFYVAISLWVAGFDIIYHIADADYDRQVGLHSIPVKWGATKSINLALLLHLGTVLFLYLFWQAAGLGTGFQVAMALVLLIFAREVYLVRRQRLSLAFNTNLVVGMIIFLFTLWDLLTI
ncbi:MAG: 4-hydroxybenzoate octaprenyltransferase [Limnochordia bacterium]|jgi:4-hydroxybenzoate polyprenyltransferase